MFKLKKLKIRREVVFFSESDRVLLSPNCFVLNSVRPNRLQTNLLTNMNFNPFPNDKF